MKVFALLLGLVPFAFAAKEVCYPNLGCFDYGYPYLDPPARPLSWAPQPPATVDPKFLLHTRMTPMKADAETLSSDDPATILKSHFDPGRETKFICHGFVESGIIEWDYWMIDMVKEFLNHADYNVIRIAWGKGSLFPFTQAVANTRIVGAETSRLIDTIKGLYNITAASFHFVGHSLGAHIGGYTGRRQQGLGRITGLDPAGPYFVGSLPEVRLDPTDALFVDVIHSDAKPTLSLGFGIVEPVGHMDFYPNNGRDQPGCDQTIIEDIIDEGLVGGAVQFVACNHMRSHELFTDSINMCQIYAFRCPLADDTYDDFLRGDCFNPNDGVVMGYHSIDFRPPSGVQHQQYYTVTTDTKPFCLANPFQVRLNFDKPWFSETFRGWAYVTLIGNLGKTKRTILNEESLDFKPATERNFIFTTDIDPGDLTELQFYWDHDFSWLDPLDWPIFDDVEVYIERIEIKGLKMQKGYTMCNKRPSKGINTNTVAYFFNSSC